MKVKVDQDLCISCGACVDVCPEIFQWDDEEKAHAVTDEVPSEYEDQAHEAVEGCPTNAINES